MKIRMSILRKLIREAVLVEAQMQDPLAVAVGTAIINHMSSDEFAKAVQQNMGGKKGDVDRAAEELATTFPQSQMYRGPLEKVLRRLAGVERNDKPQFTRQRPTEDGPNADERPTIAPPPPRM